MTRVPVFADVDTGVDDAFALVYLLASADAELVGIACTAGNVAVEQVCGNTLGLLQACGATDIPVSRGAETPLGGPLPTGDAHGRTGLGYAELPPTSLRLTDHDAASAWVRAAHAHPGQLVGLATGPLTNLALALRLEPALPALLRRLVVMGGAYDGRGNTTPEWNIRVDPEAAVAVLASWGAAAQPPVLCGLDLTARIAMTPALLARLARAAGATTTVLDAQDQRGLRSSATNPLIRVLEDAMRFSFEAHQGRGHGYLAHLHDPLAAAVALDPQLVTTRLAAVDVELTGAATRGQTVVTAGREPNAQLGVDVDPGVFFDRFTRRVGEFAGSR